MAGPHTFFFSSIWRDGEGIEKVQLQKSKGTEEVKWIRYSNQFWKIRIEWRSCRIFIKSGDTYAMAVCRKGYHEKWASLSYRTPERLRTWMQVWRKHVKHGIGNGGSVHRGFTYLHRSLAPTSTYLPGTTKCLFKEQVSHTLSRELESSCL